MADQTLEFVRELADPRVGLVLLGARPLRHWAQGYVDFDDEVRDLPWNSPNIDQAALAHDFTSWGMQRLRDSNFMMAAPETLSDTCALQWLPCPILNQRNTCAACGGWIDLDGDDGFITDDVCFTKSAGKGASGTMSIHSLIGLSARLNRAEEFLVSLPPMSRNLFKKITWRYVGEN